MTTNAQDGYPEIHPLIARIESKTDRQRHLLLCWLAGRDPHLMTEALKKRDEHDALQEALKMNSLPF